MCKTWANVAVQKGVFRIVEGAEDKGASLWKFLKSYQKNRRGWISLNHVHSILLLKLKYTNQKESEPALDKIDALCKN